MAVIVQYIVVRNGEQKMTFTSKKEADAYDKLLDIADRMQSFMQASGVDLEEDEAERLAFYLAENRDQAMTLLRGGKLKAVTASGTQEKKTPARKNAKAAKAVEDRVTAQAS